MALPPFTTCFSVPIFTDNGMFVGMNSSGCPVLAPYPTYTSNFSKSITDIDYSTVPTLCGRLEKKREEAERKKAAETRERERQERERQERERLERERLERERQERERLERKRQELFRSMTLNLKCTGCDNCLSGIINCGFILVEETENGYYIVAQRRREGLIDVHTSPLYSVSSDHNPHDVTSDPHIIDQIKQLIWNTTSNNLEIGYIITTDTANGTHKNVIAVIYINSYPNDRNFYVFSLETAFNNRHLLEKNQVITIDYRLEDITSDLKEVIKKIKSEDYY